MDIQIAESQTKSGSKEATAVSLIMEEEPEQTLAKKGRRQGKW